MALSVWLYKVARNQCLMKRRRSKHEGQQEVYDEALPDKYTWDNQVPPSPEALLLKLERAEQVLAHIRALPDQHRVVLTLHDLEELDTSEIAELLDTSEGSVRVRLHRARKLLRNNCRLRPSR